jgi:predicted AAA+ superfamily ATPase
MIIRQNYLDRLIEYKDKKPIKVITGVRRCGKSVLLQQYHDHLIRSGVDPDHIISINFESLKYEKLKDYRPFYEYILSAVQKNGRSYILLDEIQEVTQWEKAITSFQVDLNCDLYITGSNAHVLSSELATYLAGRYVDIHLFPFSFKEYLSMVGGDVQQQFRQYLNSGGFPGLVELAGNEVQIRDYLRGLYHTIVVKDIIARNNIQDVELLQSILYYMIDNVSNLASANKIADYLTSNNRKTYPAQVSEYLNAFENAFVLYRADRYNMKGKKILRSPYKYYLVDNGFRNIALGFRDMDLGHVLENIIYLELLRRGFDVRTGTEDHHEIDFVAARGQEKQYFQVALSVVDETVLRRELSALLAIQDNYPKTILTMDYHIDETNQGIRLVNILDFLLA